MGMRKEVPGSCSECRLLVQFPSVCPRLFSCALEFLRICFHLQSNCGLHEFLATDSSTLVTPIHLVSVF